ncbi:IclR family transcriptional regulator [Paenibacillus sp. URB8-2]|uniref:IclR family transcriptional regulator n=1 Tax=Paenibacillus sp. URB8-2 TaxID=2741301 RepID=UPI0015B84B41|nr:IclR family transcriptional regulator [Paenibacillus sp. URB8-2]BCG58782.1 DNA-binding transcriptional regulator KdgR [Paenibacillus sp. URB8-2]
MKLILYIFWKVFWGVKVITAEVGTLKKGLDIIKLLIQYPSLTVQEIMDALGCNKSTTYRLVSTLEKNEFIARNEHHRYQISDSFTLSLMARNQPMPNDLNWVAVPAMSHLSRITNESVYVGILRGTEVMTTQVVSGQYTTRSHSEIGSKSNINHDAIGKCILAFQKEDVQRRIIQAMPFVERTEHTIIDRHQLEEELRRIKESGYALDNEEGEIGVRCIAAPIVKNGKVFAAVALSGPSVRLSKEKDETHIRLVRQCADEISQTLADTDLLLDISD